MCSSFRPTFSPTLPPRTVPPLGSPACLPLPMNGMTDVHTWVKRGGREGGRGTLTFLWQQLSISEVHFAAAAAAVAFRSVEFLAFSFSFSFSLSSFVLFSFRSPPPPPPSFFAFVGKWEREGGREGEVFRWHFSGNIEANCVYSTY